MTKLRSSTPAHLALAFLIVVLTAIGTGCAEPSGAGGQSGEDFEIRSMIAADRQQMQAMDERLRRMESQIQDLVHNPPQAANETPPSKPQPPPPVTPAEPAAPVLGAPPVPNNSSAPAPPNAGANPAGAPPAVSGNEEGSTTIASAPNPPSAEEGASTEGANPPAANAPENNAAEANAPEGNNEEGVNPNEGGNAEAANPPAQPNEEGGASGGEEVASAPPAATENTPAAIPPARWPQDLSAELQAPSKGAPGKLFRSGLDAMKSRDYQAALERFGTLQKKYPHSDLTEPAAYFSASALNEMGKYDQAILQYNDLVMRYPKGKYASEALLREAQDFVHINDKVDARLTLQKLVNEHAGTPQAAAAGEMLKGLESD